MNNTYIKLSRNLITSDVFASQKMLKIWIWLLLKANFKDRSVPLKIGKGERIIKIKRGQLLFGRFKAEYELFIDGSTIYKIIKKFESLGMIKIQSNNQYSIITICKYEHYQSSNTYEVATEEQPSNNQVTTKEQPKNTPKKEKKEKIYISPHDFYKKEIEENNQCDFIKEYGMFYDLLNGKNASHEILTNILSIPKQVSYKQFNTLLKKSKQKEKKFSSVLLKMENNPKYTAKRKSLSLTLHNWLDNEKY